MKAFLKIFLPNRMYKLDIYLMLIHIQLLNSNIGLNNNGFVMRCNIINLIIICNIIAM